jgi:hypothetical protein
MPSPAGKGMSLFIEPSSKDSRMIPRATPLLQSIPEGVGCRRGEREIYLAVGINIFFDLSKIFPDNRHIEKQTEDITEQPEDHKGTQGKPEASGDAGHQIGNDPFLGISIILQNILEFRFFQGIGYFVEPRIQAFDLMPQLEGMLIDFISFGSAVRFSHKAYLLSIACWRLY